MALKTPEILAPVGDWQMCQAAVHNGADAIYLGMPGFNARGRSKDFSTSELKEIVDFCHLYGVKVFVACNILIFESEFEELEQQLHSIIELGIDAFIVQDLGLVQLIKEIAPLMPVHASTQMTVTNVEAIKLLESLGIERFVLGRENSLSDLAKIKAETDKELEVFVHGALCVSYSGQCLTSESNSNRSANRGQCNQSCRFQYQISVDGKIKDLAEKKHLVSPQDLYGLEDLDRLIQIGIDSFKIEGRLKSPEYVASTVRNYKQVSSQIISNKSVTDFPRRRQDLALAFARGSFNGWYDGVNHQRLVDARFARPRGIEIGSVESVSDSALILNSTQALQAGDGLVLHDFNSNLEFGGNIFFAEQIKNSKNKFKVKFSRDFQLKKIREGMNVFLTSRSSFDSEQRASYLDKNRLRKINLKAKIIGELGQLLTVIYSDSAGNSVEFRSEEKLTAAKSSAADYQSVYKELAALSGTAFRLESLEYKIAEGLFVNNKILKQLRQKAIAALLEHRISNPKRSNYFEQIQISPVDKSSDLKNSDQIQHDIKPIIQPQLTVLVRDESQIYGLKGLSLSCVYLDYEYNKSYENSLRMLREWGFKVGIATTRILKPQELGHIKYIKRLKPDCVLVRNLGALHVLQDSALNLIGDFSLNVSNCLSAKWLLSKGLTRLTASYDLNLEQLKQMQSKLEPGSLEVTVHQYMPSFHMEHCVFAAFLSSGTSYRDCGRPCEKHRVALIDQSGIAHPLKADAECRNTMYQGRAQSSLRLIPELVSVGIRDYRLEALYEGALELREKIEIYSAAFLGADISTLNSQLGIKERYGVSDGQFLNFSHYKSFKKDSLPILS